MTLGNRASHIWRKLIRIKKKVEHNIWWQLKSCEIYFLSDNWIKQGPLYYVEEDGRGEEKIEVKNFIIEVQWDKGKLLIYISEEMVEYIFNNISPVLHSEDHDKPWGWVV